MDEVTDLKDDIIHQNHEWDIQKRAFESAKHEVEVELARLKAPNNTLYRFV